MTSHAPGRPGISSPAHPSTHRKIAVIGAGYVGLTTAACLAHLGHHVACTDIDHGRIDRLRQGEVDLLEPGLTDLVASGLNTRRLTFHTRSQQAVAEAEFVFLCVPTPMGHDGSTDVTALDAVIDDIHELLDSRAVVVVKSTVPVGTATRIRNRLDRPDIAVASNPEFLQEGAAVACILNPDRIVIGADTVDISTRVAELYANLQGPIIRTDTTSAEMIKYVSNGFLAAKLSYVNTVDSLCEATGADSTGVLAALGLDRRVGEGFLRPGPGWGGPCLPKDVQALIHLAQNHHVDHQLLSAAVDANTRRWHHVVEAVRTAAGGDLADVRVGMLGLTFKAGTNDLRGSPALMIAELLAACGAVVAGFDPAIPAGQEILGVEATADAYQCVAAAKVLLICTEWGQFRDLDWHLVAKLMEGHTVIDTRGLLDRRHLARAGLVLQGIGNHRIAANRKAGEEKHRHG